MALTAIAVRVLYRVNVYCNIGPRFLFFLSFLFLLMVIFEKPVNFTSNAENTYVKRLRFIAAPGARIEPAGLRVMK